MTALAFGLCTVTASYARAKPPRLVALDYVAPAPCPSGTAFRDRVEARTKDAVFVVGPVAEAQIAVSVSVSVDTDGSHAKVRVPGATAERTLDGDTCDEVVDASALLVAIAVEETAVEPRVEEKPPPPSPAQLVLVGHGGITTSSGPELGPAAKIAVGVRDDGRAFAPEARLEGRFASGGEIVRGAAAASFSMFGVAASGCPFAFGPRRLRVAPCAAFTVGSLAASATGFPDAKRESRLWISAEAGARMDVALGTLAFVELEGWAVFPLLRERFAFGPTIIHETRLVGAAATLGAGVHFP